MERYGRDYGRGRRRPFGFQGYDEEYSVGYGGSPGYRIPSNPNSRSGRRGNQNGWDEFGEGHGHWGARDDPRDTFPMRQARFDQEGWGQRQPHWLRHRYDNDFGSGTSRYGRAGGGRHFRGDQDDYDRDFMDRVRRGWNHFRDETREWLNRGYDRW